MNEGSTLVWEAQWYPFTCLSALGSFIQATKRKMVPLL